MSTGRVPTTANSPLTAKGDLFTYDTNQARLAVGSNGDTLLADSAATTGLRWSAQVAASNPVINGGMDIWQRGTSVAVSGAGALTFAADRWGFFRTGFATGMTVSRQATGDTTNLPFIQYSQRVQRDSGNTSTAIIYNVQNFETVNSIPYAGKTVTFSFYARAGANFSAASSALGIQLVTGTGTDQNVLNGFTGNATPINSSATLTTTWQRFTFTGTLGATITQIAPVLYYTPVGTAGANDWFEFTGVQIDVGSVALPFRRSGNTLAGEYALAQRYYQRINATQAYYRWATGMVLNSTNSQYVIPFKATMRTTPTFAASGNFEHIEGSSTRSTTAPTLSVDGNGPDSVTINGALTSANTGYAIMLRSGNSTASYLEFSAEL